MATDRARRALPAQSRSAGHAKMTVGLWVLAGVFVAAAGMGVPMGLSMLVAGFAYLIATHQDPGLVVDQTMNGLYNNYLIAAVPMFIFVANLMNASGVLERLLVFAQAMVGRFRGGLAHHPLREHEKPFEDAARVHQIGDEDEHRDGKQQIVVVKAVHGLIDDEAGVLMSRDEVGEPSHEHGEAHGHAHSRCRDEDSGQHPESDGHLCMSCGPALRRQGAASAISRHALRATTASRNSAKQA